jgi:hypothetical protein
MTMARPVFFHRRFQPLLIAALVLAPTGFAGAWQSLASPPPPRLVVPIVVPPPDLQFRQAVQQQQVTDQLQKSQLQQQLHQSVSDQAKQPGVKDASLQQQLKQADRARRDRDRAAQQDIVDRNRDRAASLPRVIPQGQPASSQSGG